MFLRQQVVEVADISAPGQVDAEAAVNELAEAQGTLLAIQELVSTIRVFGPVHTVQGESLADGVNDGFLFRVIIDELALIRRADIQLAAICDNASFLVVFEASENAGYCDFNGGVISMRYLHSPFSDYQLL